MGQPVTVVVKPAPDTGSGGTDDGILIFELNRSITGMGHRNYLYSSYREQAGDRERDGAGGIDGGGTKDEDGDGQKNLADEVAHRLFEGFGESGLESVHINSNILTVRFGTSAARGKPEAGAEAEAGFDKTEAGKTVDEITKMLEEIFLFYK